MTVSASKPKSLVRSKYVEYRRKYNHAKAFSKKLDQPKPEKTAKPELAQKAAQTNPSNQALGTQSSQLTAQQAKLGEQKMQTAMAQEATAKYAQFSENSKSRMVRKLAAYKPYIKSAAARYDLPEELIAGVIWQESRGNPRAVSHCGAMGLMQLMPGTARNLGVQNAFHPAQNIDGGAKYLRQMLDKFGKVEYAVAAYNAGPGNVQKYGGIPPFKETQNYVPKVLGGAQAFKVAGGFTETEQPTALRV